MPDIHALLSPSSASRWLTCTPSARLEEGYEEKSSVYAEEGTLAHKLAEITLQYKLVKHEQPNLAKVKYLADLQEIKKDPLYSPEMDQYVAVYVSMVEETYWKAQKQCPDTQLIIEGKLDYSKYVPDGFGTGDAVIVSDSEIHVLDLKYGKGIQVEVGGNPQFKLYALGAYLGYGLMYAPKTATATVVQPRLDHIDSVSMSIESLLDWAETELKQKAELAYAGEGELVIGDHCKFCKNKINCFELKKETNKMAKKAFDKVQPSNMKPKTLADLLVKANVVIDYLKAVQDWALIQVRDEGMHIPGFKLVAGKSNRKYIDESAVANRLSEKGIPVEEIYNLKLLTITEMEKKLKNDVFNEVLGDLVVKPEPAPVLVPESDKRVEWQPKVTVEEAFKEV